MVRFKSTFSVLNALEKAVENEVYLDPNVSQTNIQHRVAPGPSPPVCLVEIIVENEEEILLQTNVQNRAAPGRPAPVYFVENEVEIHLSWSIWTEIMALRQAQRIYRSLLKRLLQCVHNPPRCLPLRNTLTGRNFASHSQTAAFPSYLAKTNRYSYERLRLLTMAVALENVEYH
ncbi:hypothetical protein J6590_002753 [Homalodisca vitripennis]|nr:hypothetical protein J6590_002753 [Homalodisca vitripennis]